MTKTRPHPKPSKPKHFLKEWRVYRGLTQERLAERMGVSNGLISQLENGQTAYTQSTLEGAAFALNCEPADLLTRDPSKEGEVVDLLALIRRKDQKTVLAIVNGLPDVG